VSESVVDSCCLEPREQVEEFLKDVHGRELLVNGGGA
jgi:hypothetical protein